MELLKLRDAARILNISYPTLKQWIYSGKVRTTTTEGGHHRIADAEVERLLARYPQSVHGAAEARPRPGGMIVALSNRG